MSDRFEIKIRKSDYYFLTINGEPTDGCYTFREMITALIHILKGWHNKE